MSVLSGAGGVRRAKVPVYSREGTDLYAAMTQLIDCLDSKVIPPEVIDWASPVPYFGAISEAVVATVGINPSNREFADAAGCELDGARRRLHTLTSLGVDDWSQTSGADIRQITRACESYFDNNPYRRWFDVLDRLLRIGGASLYSVPNSLRACHLDLVAFATNDKWGRIDAHVRRSLVQQGRLTMATIIRDSPILLLILNGRSVVREFASFAGAALNVELVPEWVLPRSAGKSVPGVLYTGTLCKIAGVSLDRHVSVVGYNHNLQSSFGVTAKVAQSIGEKVGQSIVSVANR